jgi:adenosylhomocysteine nucleosidase
MLACATATEARVGRRRGARAAVVGLGCARGVPDGRVVSFGLAGALHDGLACGDVLDAVRVVDERGATLWEGGPLGAAGARAATILAADRIVDDPAERRRLHAATGADAVDMESGALARAGRLAGVVRAVSDTPSQTLGPLGRALGPEGRIRPRAVADALASPRATARALRGIRRGLRGLGGALA